LPHGCIGNGSGELPISHHSQDVEVFDANDPTGARQLSREFVLHISAKSGNLLMLARYLEPLFLIFLAEHGSLGSRVFRLLFDSFAHDLLALVPPQSLFKKLHMYASNWHIAGTNYQEVD
jgi:hypothetical protein